VVIRDFQWAIKGDAMGFNCVQQDASGVNNSCPSQSCARAERRKLTSANSQHGTCTRTESRC